MITTLFISAHPDDIETMMSGALEQHTITCVATDGEASTVNLLDQSTFVTSKRRRDESKEGLLRCGIPLDHQYYLGLPDGDLASKNTFDTLTKKIVGILREHAISSIYTLGPDGFDEHPDHIATHLAALKAVEQRDALQAAPITIYGLNAHDTGTCIYTANTDRKLHAMCAHKSQFKIQETPRSTPPDSVAIGKYSVDVAFWDYFSPYHTLILKRETYDIFNHNAH